MKEHMLTTTDNPYNPFTQFLEWQSWDETHGYYSLPLLARVCKVSNELSDSDQSIAIEMGIEEIVRENISGMHRRVTRDSAG